MQGRDGRFAPLRDRRYRHRCIATLLANIGHWSQLSAVAWYMVETSGREELGGFVQSAAMAPVLLCTMTGGLLADRHDGEAIQRWAQAGVVTCAGALAYAAWIGAHPFWLLALLFMHGVGLAVRAPAWQASLLALVGQKNLAAAVLLNASAFNLARIVGAALGGLLLSNFGLVVVCAVNALLASTLLLALLTGGRPCVIARATVRGSLTEAFAHTLCRRVACRSLALGMPASAILALLPAHVSTALGGDAAAYGHALAWFGAGAVAGGLCTTNTARTVGVERAVGLQVLVLAAAMAALALCHDATIAAPCLAAAGAAWTTLFAKINTTLQLGVPDTIRGTALALYITCMFGGMTLGSAAWSLLAAGQGTSHALLVAAVALTCCIPSGWRWPLRSRSSSSPY